jgi:hypothetical protein
MSELDWDAEISPEMKKRLQEIMKPKDGQRIRVVQEPEKSDNKRTAPKK